METLPVGRQLSCPGFSSEVLTELQTQALSFVAETVVLDDTIDPYSDSKLPVPLPEVGGYILVWP